MAQVALTLVLAKPDVTAPIIRVTRLAQVDDALLAHDLSFDADEIAGLEKAYVAHPVLGHA